MDMMNNLKAAHKGSVNSVFVNLEVGVVIGVDEDSIRIWDPVKGTELHVYDANDDDSLIPGLNNIYRVV